MYPPEEVRKKYPLAESLMMTPQCLYFYLDKTHNIDANNLLEFAQLLGYTNFYVTLKLHDAIPIISVRFVK